MTDDNYLRIGDPKRPYIRDVVDESAAALYAAGGFAPPERPDGFLDAHEGTWWARWRHKVSGQENGV